MNKLSRRSLLKAAGFAAVPAGIFHTSSHAASAKAAGVAADRPISWHNWSGALRCQPLGRFAPATEDMLTRFLKTTSGPVRPLGSGHSFSPLVPTDGHLIVIDQLTGLLDYDAETGEATFGAGTRLGDVGPALLPLGRGLHNLPDIDRQSIAGAISTATHGTGLALGCLSDYITQLRLLTPNGEAWDLRAESNADLFNAARVSLGALGVITQVTFATRERYRLRARNGVMSTNDALDDFVEQVKSHRHYELFPFVHCDYSMTLAIDETDLPVNNPPESPEQEASFSQLLAQLESIPVSQRKPIMNEVASQLPASEAVDESFRILANVRNDRFNEMEYSVELSRGAACVREVLAAVEKQEIDVAFPLEVRAVKGDDTWLSMSEGVEDHVSISIHRQAGRDYRPYFDAIEPIFWKYGGRPHWGKVHSLGAAQLRELYPRFDEFQALRRSIDPKGRMLNNHLAKIFSSTG